MKRIKQLIDQSLKVKRKQDPLAEHVYFSLREGHYMYDCLFDSKGLKEVIVINTRKLDKTYPNVEEFLTANTLDWDDIEIEPELSVWELNGFRDAQDYYNYRYR